MKKSKSEKLALNQAFRTSVNYSYSTILNGFSIFLHIFSAILVLYKHHFHLFHYVSQKNGQKVDTAWTSKNIVLIVKVTLLSCFNQSFIISEKIYYWQKQAITISHKKIKIGVNKFLVFVKVNCKILVIIILSSYKDNQYKIITKVTISSFNLKYDQTIYRLW